MSACLQLSPFLSFSAVLIMFTSACFQYDAVAHAIDATVLLRFVVRTRGEILALASGAGRREGRLELDCTDD